MFVGQRPGRLEETGSRGDAAAVVIDWFDEQRAGFSGMSCHGRFQRLEIVVLDRNDQLGHRLGNPRALAVGWLCVQLVGGRVAADVGELVVTVEVTEEANDLVATAGGPAQPQRVQGGFGSRTGEADPLGTRDHPAELFGQVDVERRVHAAQHPVFPRGVEHVSQTLGSVTEQRGSVAHREVQELPPGDIPEPAAGRTLGVDRGIPRLVSPGTRADAAGDRRFATLKQACDGRLVGGDLHLEHELLRAKRAAGMDGGHHASPAAMCQTAWCPEGQGR